MGLHFVPSGKRPWRYRITAKAGLTIRQ